MSTMWCKYYLATRYLSKASNLLNVNVKCQQHVDSIIRHQSIEITKLQYNDYGDPAKVVSKCNECIDNTLKSNDVLVRMLASPVNPADINTIQGKYPIRPELPSVPGNEGVGEVIAVGQNVKKLIEGDRVIPNGNAFGTWRTHLIRNETDFLKVPKKLGLVEAATLIVNPCTAYRMLRDYVSLKPGDTVIQNGANSACGQNVIQIARAWGYRSVNIVRNRPEITELKAFLHDLGATHVLTEEELRTTDIFKSGQISKPRLAMNCVGGKSSLELIRHLDNGGTMVTYGGMSMEPITVPTSAFIFKDLSLRGMWMTRWSKIHRGTPESEEMVEEIISMMLSGEMHGPAYTMVPFDNYKEALINTMTVKGMVGKKFILDFQ